MAHTPGWVADREKQRTDRGRLTHVLTERLASTVQTKNIHGQETLHSQLHQDLLQGSNELQKRSQRCCGDDCLLAALISLNKYFNVAREAPASSVLNLKLPVCIPV